MKIVEMLRLSEQGFSYRQIAVGAGCGKTTVSKVLKLCKEKGITFEAASSMTDQALQNAIYPEAVKQLVSPEPDWKAIHEEIAKNKHLNLQYLWEEYRQNYPDGLSYSRFCVRVAFYRIDRLLNELTVAYGSGSLNKLLAKLKKANILILDDWGIATLNALESRFLLEVFEDRYGERSTVISAQLPVAKWHGLFEDSTVADAILDRLVHNSHRLELQGPSLRPLALQNSSARPEPSDQAAHELRKLTVNDLCGEAPDGGLKPGGDGSESNKGLLVVDKTQ